MKMTPETQRFVLDNAGNDVAALRLKYADKSLPGVDIALALTQIEARVKAKHKLPWLADFPDFVFPSALAAEQCTAQAVAEFHAAVAGACSSLLDITCGLGIDLAAMSKGAAKVVGCELSEVHARCAVDNLPLLGVGNAEVNCCDAGTFLAQLPADACFDLVFADPARRTLTNRRTYALSDCSPDIVELLPMLRRHAKRLLVKVSPMLDVNMVLSQVPDVSDVYAVAYKGECKELLLDCHLGMMDGKARYHVVEVNAAGFEVFELDDTAEREMLVAEDATPVPGQYLLEPSPALMKFVGRIPVTARWPGLRKLGSNTHLYVSDTMPCRFPGRVLRIAGVLPYQRKCAGGLPKHMNVVTRNFPDTPQGVKKRLKLADGGRDFLYCCRLLDHAPVLLHCQPNLDILRN